MVKTKRTLEPVERRRSQVTAWLTESEKSAVAEIGPSQSAAILKIISYYVERERPDLKKYFRVGTFGP
jgi:hypothetical protein